MVVYSRHAKTARKRAYQNATSRKSSLRLCLEVLEDRIVPSVIYPANNGFELPNLHSNTSGNYKYPLSGGTVTLADQGGSGWTFSGLTGVADNGSDPRGNSFNVMNATNGNQDGTTSNFGQAALIQSGSSLSSFGPSIISQAITFPGSGNASVTFSIELRGDLTIGDNPIDVKFDDLDLGIYLALSGSSFNTVTTPSVFLTAGTHTLSFTGTNTLGSDNTQFIDNVSITSSPSPDIAPTQLAWDMIHGGVSFSYEVTGAPLSADTTAQLYWAGGTTTDAILEPATTPIPIPMTVPVGQVQTVHLAQGDFPGGPAPGTTYLLAVVDPDSKIDEGLPGEQNNALAMQLPDASVTTLSWHTDHLAFSGGADTVNGGGVDVTFQVDGVPVPTSTTLSVYWAKGTNPSSILENVDDPVFSQIVPAGFSGLSDLIHVPAAQLGTPPDGTTDLLAIFDPSGNMFKTNHEDDPSHAQTFKDLGATPKDIVSVSATGVGTPDITATFTPARGALTLAQAEKLCGVDHFNWEQVMYPPSNWKFEVGPAPGPNLTLADLKDPTGPLFDPLVQLVGTQPTYYYIIVNGDITNVERIRDLGDQYTPYLDEVTVGQSDNNLWQGFNIPGPGGTKDPFTFVFHDKPNFPSGSYNGAGPYKDAGPYWAFATQLVGVTDINNVVNVVRFPGVPNTRVLWSDNSVYNSGGIVSLAVSRPISGFDPPVISGGVASIQLVKGLGIPTVTVTDAGGAYDGPRFLAVASVAGVIQGVDDTPASKLENVGLSLEYLRVNPDQSLTDLGASAPVDAGSYQAVASFAGSQDYTPASASTTFRITPAPLTVTADDQTIVYAQPIPQLDGILSGVVQGDNITASYITSATSTSNVGTYVITPSLNDPNGRLANYVVTMKNGTLTIQSVAIEPDPVNPGQNDLFVGGTSGDDHIEIGAEHRGTIIEVNIRTEGRPGFKFSGDFNGSSLSRIFVFGGPGNDDIEVDDKVTLPALLFGGAGNDHIEAGGGPTVIVGGSGDDHLEGGSGSDILIGGTGNDHIEGKGSSDILIAGTTAFDNNLSGLIALMSEWGHTDESYLQRVANLSNSTVNGVSPSGMGLNGGNFLAPVTVHDDGAGNHLEGGPGLDWYFANLDGSGNNGVKDKVSGLKGGEVVTGIVF